jgi:hypothetical protein
MDPLSMSIECHFIEPEPTVLGARRFSRHYCHYRVWPVPLGGRKRLLRGMSDRSCLLHKHSVWSSVDVLGMVQTADLADSFLTPSTYYSYSNPRMGSGGDPNVLVYCS